MAQVVIAMSGHRGSGKDTAADHLIKEHGFERLSFAAKLKDMVSEMYEIKRSWFDDRLHKDASMYAFPVIPTDAFSIRIQTQLADELKSGFWTPRALCILEGSIKRAAYPNYWVQQVVGVIKSNPDRNYVISDMRYKSEADTLKVILPNIRLVRVERDIEIDTQDPSERDLDNYFFEFKVKNTGTKEQLYENLNHLIDINMRSELRDSGSVVAGRSFSDHETMPIDVR